MKDGRQVTANLQDRDGGVLLMATLFGMYPFLLKLYADAGYQGRFSVVQIPPVSPTAPRRPKLQGFKSLTMFPDEHLRSRFH